MEPRSRNKQGNFEAVDQGGEHAYRYQDLESYAN